MGRDKNLENPAIRNINDTIELMNLVYKSKAPDCGYIPLSSRELMEKYDIVISSSSITLHSIMASRIIIELALFDYIQQFRTIYYSPEKGGKYFGIINHNGNLEITEIYTTYYNSMVFETIYHAQKFIDAYKEHILICLGDNIAKFSNDGKHYTNETIRHKGKFFKFELNL